MLLRPVAFAIASAVLLFAAAPAMANPDAPPTPECTENCADAGYEWAEQNGVAAEEECNASSADFSAGCRLFVEEQRQAAAPPLEEPEVIEPESPVVFQVETGTEAEAEAEAEAQADDVAPVDPPQY